MIISEKQVIELMDYCRALAEVSSMSVIPRKALELLNKIKVQQSTELKVIE